MERKEYLFKDLPKVFTPADAFAEKNYKGKWRKLSYKHKDFEGVLISSVTADAPNLSFDPKLKGWYKIYIGIIIGSELSIKLKSETCFLRYTSSKNHKPLPGYYIEESLWREADMTNESIEISFNNITMTHLSALTPIRFVEMTAEEIAFTKAERERKDTKSLYVCNDVHNLLYLNKLEKIEDFRPIVDMNINSDAEWISFENVKEVIDAREADKLSYIREGDRFVAENYNKFDINEVYKYITSYGQEKGFKMSISKRMGAWGMGAPYAMALENEFAEKHPEFRCKDRDGEGFFALSYAYDEVQDYMINNLLESASFGADAVTLIWHRGYPYILFEKPVADKFYELYGEYPYELTLEEPRLRKLHCEIITNFMRKLRNALDKRFGKDKVEIHVRVLFSIEDSLKYALDAETWAKEKLITKLISYPMSHLDKLEGCFKDDNEDRINGRIDLAKYREYINTVGREACLHIDPDHWDLRSRNSPLMDGIISDEDRIREFNELEDKYGVEVYFDLMDRLYSNAQYKLRIEDLYQRGARRIAYWDVNTRHENNAMWNVAKLGGNEDEIKNIDPNEGYKVYRVLKLGDFHVGLYSPTWGG